MVPAASLPGPNRAITEYAILGGLDQALRQAPDVLVEMKFVELPMLGQYPAHRAGDRAHHYRFGLNDVLAEFYPAQHGAAGDPGGGKQAVALHHIVNLVLTPRVFDTHLQRALAQLFGIDDQSCLHLPADATQRRRGQHALRCSADSQIDVDTRFRFGAMDYAGHVAVTDQADRGASFAHRGDDVGMARPVEQESCDFGRLDALGPREIHDIFVGPRIKIDRTLRITGPDCDLLHVAIRCVQQRAGIGHRDGGNRPWHLLRAKRRALQRIDRNVDLRAMLGADFLANEEHRRLVDLALSNDNGAVDRQFVEFAAHGVDRSPVGRPVRAWPAPARRATHRPFGNAAGYQRRNAFQQ